MDLEDHFSEIDPTPEVREAYRTLADARLLHGMDVRKGGYMKHELHFGCKGRNVSLYRASLKKKWVLWYFRKPALNRKLYDPVSTLRHFPGAKDRGNGEITLKLYNAEDARAVLNWINDGQTLMIYAALSEIGNTGN